MKKNIAAFLFICSFFFANAQKELWGVNSGTEGATPTWEYYYAGNITKYDINGENPAIMHEFNGTEDAIPKGKLFLASNGKLYGTTLYGGNTPNSQGVLYEYNLVLNKYRILYSFDYTIYPAAQPLIGVIEPVVGQLYGATSNRMYKYDIATETITFYNILPISVLFINTEFIKANDGNLYATAIKGFCPDYTYTGWNGALIKFNINTNNLSVAHYLDCGVTNEGNAPSTTLIEFSSGKLIGCTGYGGINSIGSYNPQGTIFEYNYITNIFTKKIDMNYSVTGGGINSLVNGNNGKLFGLCEYGGIPPGNTSTNSTDFRGTLFEYTPTTNAIEVKQYFGTTLGNYVRYPTSLMKTSLGTFVGTIPNGALFKWNDVTNIISHPDYSNVDSNLINANNNASLIEICRKPAYQEILVNSFTVATGENFSYNVQNTNATTYQWQQNGVNVAGQTAGILNLVNVTAANNGIYTCVMTNECGTTTTAPLTINVGNLGVNEVIASLEGNIKLYPNPTNSIVNIELPENINVSINELKINDILGKEIYKTKENKTKIDVSSYAKGVYIVSLKTNYGNWNGKFVKN